MVGGVLWRKLVREVWRAKAQQVALAITVGLGVAFYAGASAIYADLERSYLISQERLRMEDFGIALRSAPATVAQRVRSIEGVAGVEGRLVEDLAIEIGEVNPRRLSGRIIGIRTDQPLEVNQLLVVAGRGLSPTSRREVLLESKFAQFHSLRPGDYLTLLWRGERIRFRVVGLVRSPELIYVVPSKEQLLPSEDIFGVMFAPCEVVGELIGQAGTINEVKVTVQAGYDPVQVARLVHQSLRVYGAEDPVMQEDQPSHAFLMQSLQELETFATLFPIMFLGTSMLVLYTLLARWVNRQRHLIGLMRAIGYSSGQVMRHYLAMATMPALLGGMLGALLTVWAGNRLSQVYMSFLAFPYEVLEPPWQSIGIGFLLGVLICLSAGFQPAWQASRIPPAVALRPPTPALGRLKPIDQWIPILRRATLFARLPLRNLMRTPRRTITGMLGIACGMMLAMLARGILDSQRMAVDSYLNQSLREDLRVVFLRPQDGSVVARIRSWEGVLWAEGMLELPIKVRKGKVEYETTLRGVEPHSPLLTLTEEAGNRVPLTEQGVVCGQVVQQKFNLERGDTLWLELPTTEGDERVRARAVRVSGLVWETIGGVVYMPRKQVRALFHRDLDLPPNAINSVRLNVHPDYQDQVVRRLKQLPESGIVVVRGEVLEQIESLLELGRRFISVMMSFGFILASAVVFSVVTLSVLERRNEVATLLTIGFGKRQVMGLLFAESMLVVLGGILIGLPFGRMMVSLFIQMASTPEQMELFAFRTYVLPMTYFLSALGVFVVSLVSLVPAVRSAIQIDLVSALKERAV